MTQEEDQASLNLELRLNSVRALRWVQSKSKATGARSRREAAAQNYRTATSRGPSLMLCHHEYLWEIPVNCRSTQRSLRLEEL